MLGVPRAQQNDRSALTLLALLDVKSNTSWKEARQNLIGITEMMDYFRDNYGVNYAPNTRETIRRQTVHQFIQLGLVAANPDDHTRPINSPKTRYVVENTSFHLIRSFGLPDWHGNLHQYLKTQSSLTSLQLREREMTLIPVVLPDSTDIKLSIGGQNVLIKKIIEEFCPRFTPGGRVIYIGDAGNKLTENEIQYFSQMGLLLDKHGKMPDIVIDYAEKNWLILVEAVTSRGPVDQKRQNELKELFRSSERSLVFVTAFESRKAMNKFMSEIAWETEVWVAESSSHLIHFNGERFLGPYPGESC
jgi:adenine-specific DNA-methyltransferase